jgi:hypothetical protein
LLKALIQISPRLRRRPPLPTRRRSMRPLTLWNRNCVSPSQATPTT